MNILKIKLINNSMEVLEVLEINVPEWATHVSVERDVVSCWDCEPNYYNGGFDRDYDDPEYMLEDVATLSKEYPLQKPYNAFCDVSKSRGIMLVAVD